MLAVSSFTLHRRMPTVCFLSGGRCRVAVSLGQSLLDRTHGPNCIFTGILLGRLQTDLAIAARTTVDGINPA